METAILKKDFQTFAKLTMQDSNQFHAICLDTYPPITYMNDTSRRIISLITKYNDLQDEIKVCCTLQNGDCTNREFCLSLALKVNTVFNIIWFFLLQVAYSYDAGPNAVLFVESKNVPELLSLIKYYFPPTEEQSK